MTSVHHLLKQIIVFTICSVFFLWYPQAYAASEAVAKVVWVKGDVKAQDLQKANRALQRGSDLYEGDTLITATASTGQIVFTDQSVVVLSPNTSLQIKNYKLDRQNKSNEKYALNLVKGGMRTITGVIPKDNPNAYQVKTPTATIGVRGTDFSVCYLCKQGPEQKGMLHKLKKMLSTSLNSVIPTAQAQEQTSPSGAAGATGGTSATGVGAAGVGAAGVTAATAAAVGAVAAVTAATATTGATTTNIQQQVANYAAATNLNPAQQALLVQVVTNALQFPPSFTAPTIGGESASAQVQTATNNLNSSLQNLTPTQIQNVVSQLGNSSTFKNLTSQQIQNIATPPTNNLQPSGPNLIGLQTQTTLAMISAINPTQGQTFQTAATTSGTLSFSTTQAAISAGLTTPAATAAVVQTMLQATLNVAIGNPPPSPQQLQNAALAAGQAIQLQPNPTSAIIGTTALTALTATTSLSSTDSRYVATLVAATTAASFGATTQQAFGIANNLINKSGLTTDRLPPAQIQAAAIAGTTATLQGASPDQITAAITKAGETPISPNATTAAIVNAGQTAGTMATTTSLTEIIVNSGTIEVVNNFGKMQTLSSGQAIVISPSGTMTMTSKTNLSATISALQQNTISSQTAPTTASSTTSSTTSTTTSKPQTVPTQGNSICIQ